MTPTPVILLAALAVVCLVAALIFLVRSNRISRELAGAEAKLATLSKYQSVIDTEAHNTALVAQAAERVRTLDEERNSRAAELEQLGKSYAEAKSTYDRLRAELALVEENIEDVSFGLYRPHYSFDSSEDYKRALEGIYDRKKAATRNGSAATCATEWSVGGSKKEGERMTKQNIKVMLRAFNGEVDAAVAKVAWNNATKMEERIRKSFDGVNAAGTANRITISDSYLGICLDELRLTHEYELKRREEQEEQRAIREQMREEEKARREFERAEKEAADDEERYDKALARARAEVEKASGAELGKANDKVKELEAKLAEAHAKMERAKSMAEQTRQGYVYILSNVGSFGEEVYKIGMTRRLDPMDRVKELSDASVPFQFDVHAMAFSTDAPALENAFHRQFSERRVNLVNFRKEYFRVSLPELEAFAKGRGVQMELTLLAEAREYRETLAMREKVSAAPVTPPPVGEAFPDSLPGVPAVAPVTV